MWPIVGGPGSANNSFGPWCAMLGPMSNDSAQQLMGSCNSHRQVEHHQHPVACNEAVHLVDQPEPCVLVCTGVQHAPAKAPCWAQAHLTVAGACCCAQLAGAGSCSCPCWCSLWHHAFQTGSPAGSVWDIACCCCRSSCWCCASSRFLRWGPCHVGPTPSHLDVCLGIG